MDKSVDAARLQEIYSRTAAFYDEIAAKHQAAAKEIAIGLLDRQPGERFLEVAFGTGWALTRVLKGSAVADAYGIELAPGMLDVALGRLSQEPPSLPALLLGDCCRLPFQDACFECLLCTYTLECLPVELIAATLGEFRRVLRPGGSAVIADLTDGEGEDAVMTEEWRQGFARDPEFFGGARPLRLRPLLEEAGLDVVERRYSGHGAGWPSEVVKALR